MVQDNEVEQTVVLAVELEVSQSPESLPHWNSLHNLYRPLDFRPLPLYDQLGKYPGTLLNAQTQPLPPRSHTVHSVPPSLL